MSRAFDGGAALALLLLLGGCGGNPRNEVLDLGGPRQPRFILEGACTPSVKSTELPVIQRDSHCARTLSAPTLAVNEAEYATLFEDSCERPAVDFTVHRALVISARGGESFSFLHFLRERADALEVGLVTRPQGALPPDAVVLLPRSPAPIELRWCRSVCVENCDVPIP